MTQMKSSLYTKIVLRETQSQFILFVIRSINMFQKQLNKSTKKLKLVQDAILKMRPLNVFLALDGIMDTSAQDSG